MAVTENVQRISGALKLNNGTEQGVVKTVTLSIGSFDKDEWDGDKVMNIVDLLKPCLSKGVVDVQKTTVTHLYRN